MLTIEALFNPKDLEKEMNDGLQVWFNELAAEMMKIGRSITDQAIAKVKGQPFTGMGFGNITYNLRSSIGCGLFMGNSIKEDYFPFGKGDVGQQHGRELMRKVAAEIPSEQIGLIFVVGEKYGVFVQEKGYDVTDMSWEHFRTEIGWEVSNG